MLHEVVFRFEIIESKLGKKLLRMKCQMHGKFC